MTLPQRSRINLTYGPLSIETRPLRFVPRKYPDPLVDFCNSAPEKLTVRGIFVSVNDPLNSPLPSDKAIVNLFVVGMRLSAPRTMSFVQFWLRLPPLSRTTPLVRFRTRL